MKEQIILAARMYDLQDKAKRFYGKEYREKIKWYVGTLKAVMAAQNLNEVQAILFINEMDSVKGNAMAILCFTAAAVEIMEPEKSTV